MANGCWSKCYKCGCDMWVPRELDVAARAARGTISMYCAYGHGQVYAEGETEAEKLRRERDQLRQRIAERDDEIAARDQKLTAARGQITKLRKRVGNGACPCCNRFFKNLSSHMKTQHPEYADNVVEFKAESA